VEGTIGLAPVPPLNFNVRRFRQRGGDGAFLFPCSLMDSSLLMGNWG
jgi:hypothetical protein